MPSLQEKASVKIVCFGKPKPGHGEHQVPVRGNPSANLLRVVAVCIRIGEYIPFRITKNRRAFGRKTPQKFANPNSVPYFFSSAPARRENRPGPFYKNHTNDI